jgi:hypothetical protein
METASTILGRFVPRQICPRLPPGPSTGRAFFAENVHWTFSDRSSPLGRRDSAPAQAGAGRFYNRWSAPPRPLPNGLQPYGQQTDDASTGRAIRRFEEKGREESFRQTLITLWHSSRNVSKPLTSPVDNVNGRLISLNNPEN